METRRFARSGNSFLFGVCAGLAEYIGVPVMLVRVVWVVLAFTSWLGWLPVIAYVVLMFVMPPPEGTPEGRRFDFSTGFKGRNAVIVLAIVLIFWGASIIVNEFLHINISQYLLPVGLVLGGGLLMVFAFRGGRKQ